MKRILSILVLIALVLTVVGCDGTVKDSEEEITEIGTEPADTETEPIDTETEPAETKPPLDYRDLECRAVDAWKQIGLTWQGESEAIIMAFPENWTLKKFTDDMYIILWNGKDIGDIRTGYPTAALDIVKGESYTNGAIELNYQVRRVREGRGEAFRRVFGFFYADGALEHSLFVELDYAALDDAAVEHICAGFAAGNRYSGEVTLSLDGGNSSKTILVAGNSFVSTSRVGVYFTQFVKNGKQPYEVYWNSTGYASISQTYTVGDWINRIKSGEFHAVVMCGFYSAADVTAMQTLVDACEASDTKLIMFPAHNEGSTHISSAMKQYPDVPFLDWKGEINRFIAAGKSKWDFCINDSHSHSNALAGYVGAHMLYMALFGEVPPDYMGSDPMSMSEIRSKLGEDYVKTGKSPGEVTYDVFELAQ